jgi:radical SAM superfamily enzyme YgiQ (UPF0313 family)
MKILLFKPRTKSWSPNVYLPLGLAYVGAVLEQDGHKVEIIDLNVQKCDVNKIKNADMVGITGMITEYNEAMKLADFIKHTNKKAKVVIGGALATSLSPSKLLKQADILVLGEGEDTVVKLAQALEHRNNLDDVKGIVYGNWDKRLIACNAPSEPIVDLDTIPFPARHLLDMKKYRQNYFDIYGFKIRGFGKIHTSTLITSRGCPYSCTYCYKGMWGNKWRGRSAENIVSELMTLYEAYDINGFVFNDDTFVLDKKRVYEFCHLLNEKKLKVVWYCNGRVNLVSKELLCWMSGNRLRDRIRKPANTGCYEKANHT